MSEVKKPKCKLVGKDGNVFSVISNVSQALRKANQLDRIKEWETKAFECGSYDEVLRLLTGYVDAN